VTASESKPRAFLGWWGSRLIIAVGGLGAIWYGFVEHERLWDNIVGRSGGPLSFRFILQPTMAAFAGIYDGIKDDRLGRQPYLWTVVRDPDERRARVHEALNSTSRIILLGFAMDAFYQFRVLHAFHPGDMVIIVFLLAIAPYVLVRGPVTRLLRWYRAAFR